MYFNLARCEKVDNSKLYEFVSVLIADVDSKETLAQQRGLDLYALIHPYLLMVW